MNKKLVGLAATLAVAGGISASTLPLLIANAESHVAECPIEGACVAIELRVTSKDGSAVVRSSSLGTVIAPGVILTHNHYPLLNQDPVAQDVIAITEANGTTWMVALSDLVIQALDAGTLLIRLPDDVPLSRNVSAATLGAQSIRVGDQLTVSHRDPATAVLASGSFEVIEVLEDRVRLADPRYLIQPGDSGGGAYIGGALIGNTWSIDKAAGEPIGSFTVALLPEATSDIAAALVGSSSNASSEVTSWPDNAEIR